MSQDKKENAQFQLSALINQERFEEAQRLLESDTQLSTKWMKNYKKSIWKKLSTNDQKTLCERFSFTYTEKNTLNDILKQLSTPVLPLSFTVASTSMAKQENNSLIMSNPYIEYGKEKLSYDQDGWGTFRTHRPYYGIFKNSYLGMEKQTYLEQLFISSISLNELEKKRVLNASPTLSRFQINEFMKVFESERYRFHSLFVADQRAEIIKQIKTAEQIWDKIKSSIELDLEQSGKTKMLDSKKNLTPFAILERLKKDIKGQDEALKKISSLLYYQHRLNYEYKHVDKPSFDRIDPVLLSGSTGSGKTYIIKKSCALLGLPVLHVDASSLVSTGIRGYCMNDAIKDILRKTDKNLKDAETAIIVFDEIDKLLHHHDGESILHQLLQIIEGSTITIDKTQSEEREFSKITSISTHKMLFIFAGSFQSFIDEKKSQSGFIQSHLPQNNALDLSDIEQTGLPKELLGRINDMIVLNKLTRDDYRKILLESKSSPIKKYQQRLAINNVTHTLSEEEIELILDKAEKSPYGARSLYKIVKPFFDDVLFDAPTR